jgi:transcriptional regulator with XRE-family HTH domain
MNLLEQNSAARAFGSPSVPRFYPEKTQGTPKPPKLLKIKANQSIKSHQKATESHREPRLSPQTVAFFTPAHRFPLTAIAYCNIVISDCNMTLGEKLRYLREVEGTLRGLDRELSQLELARLIQKELGKSISQSYLSQIESGARPHLTNSTRMLLAKFFKVHPGYLVDDPEGYQNELISDIGALEDKLDLWLVAGAERFCRDHELHHALLTVARHSDSRLCLVLLGEILENPGLAERLMEVLKTPSRADSRSAKETLRKRS